MQIIRTDSSLGASNNGLDDVDEINNSDNGRDGRLSADEFDGADSPEGCQIAKDRSIAWIEGQSRKR